MKNSFPRQLSSLLMAVLATACVDAADMTESAPPPRLGWTSDGEPVPLDLIPIDLTPENIRRMEMIFGQELDMPTTEVDVSPDKNGVAADVAAGPLCGVEGELVLEMEIPYTHVFIGQDTASGDVGLAIRAHQETTIFHPPGTGRQEARHRLDVTGSLTGFGPGLPLNPRWNDPACQAIASLFKAWIIRGSAITQRGTMCVEAGTLHWAMNDYVLHSWSDATYEKKCIRVCPPGTPNCWDPGIF